MATFTLALAFAAALAATALLTPVVIALARARGWISQPRPDRWSQRPTALMGGIALYAGTMAGAVAAGAVNRATAPLWIGATAMFVLGAVDDRRRIRPHVKLVGQIAAACWLILTDPHLPGTPVWTLPVRLLWIIGITNALNLLDNMDGLAAGVAGIAALVLSSYGVLTGNTTLALLALPLAGACAGFLFYNFQPARVFMGDCGSMFLGFALSAIAILGTRRAAANVLLPLLIPVAALVVPIFDTTLVTFARRLAGRPVSQGGRDHSSHRLVALGLSERDTVLVFYLLSALFGGLALAATRLPPLVTAVIAVLLCLGLAGTGVFLGMIQVRTPETVKAAKGTILGGTVQYKKQIVQVLVDLVLVPVAYLAAYLLRFDGNIKPAILQTVVGSLPFLIAIKLMALSMTRAYRGMWRYAGMADVLAVVKGSTLGSLVAVVMIGQATAFINVSRVTFILDWLIFTNLAVAARTGLAALRHVFAGVRRTDAPRLLILGASSSGLAAAQALTDPQADRPAAVVGFLDDDPSKQQRALNGYPVIGFLEELSQVVEEEHVDACILAFAPESAMAERARSLCERLGIRYDWAPGAVWQTAGAE
jgi:UDP-GlcNAc:undecaprenyl-phosphate GlcNAc-1-phosphate transferase